MKVRIAPMYVGVRTNGSMGKLIFKYEGDIALGLKNAFLLKTNIKQGLELLPHNE